MFETTGGIIIPAMYDTLLTFQNNDVSAPMPGLAESWEANEDATEFTFTLRDDAVFSDGSPVEAADVAFSLNRVRELKSSGAFLMEGVTAEAVDASTVRLMTEAPNPALPRILPTPTLGIVNSDVVIENGGTDQPGADADDTAEEFLNSTSAGSGPYVLESFSTTGETVVAANPSTSDRNPAAFDRIVFRNSDVTTQAIDVQNGNADIVMDLASDQLGPLRGAEGSDDRRTASPTIFFVFANANPEISEVTSNPDFVEAVRYGLDYDGILELAGEGAVQAPGVIPTHFLGTLGPWTSAVQRDVARAQEALARCTACEGATVQLEYPSDLTVSGLSFRPIAERIVANLEEVGISVELTPGPVATTLENYRAGTEQMGLWLWNPDYPTRRTTSCSDRVSSSACAPAGPRALPRRSRQCRRTRRRLSTTPSACHCSRSSSRCSTNRARSSRCSSRPARSSRSPIGSAARRSIRRCCSTCGALLRGYPPTRGTSWSWDVSSPDGCSPPCCAARHHVGGVRAHQRGARRPGGRQPRPRAIEDPEAVAAFNHRYGLDKPLPVQYFTYLGNLFQGDFGDSQQSRRPVREDLAEYAPATLELAGTAIAISMVIGVGLGTLAAFRPRSARRLDPARRVAPRGVDPGVLALADRAVRADVPLAGLPGIGTPPPGAIPPTT